MRLLLLLGLTTWCVTFSEAAVLPPIFYNLYEVEKKVDAFSTNFTKTINENEVGNYICSPVGAAMMLSMAAFGARGNTKQQLASALGLEINDEKINSGLKFLVNEYAKVEGVDLRLGLNLFTHNGAQAKAEFNDAIDNTFGLKTGNVDTGKSIGAGDIVDDTEMIVYDDLSQKTALVLVNAVYFDGHWTSKFDASHTTSRPFHVDPTTVKNVPTMHRLGYYHYNELPEIDAKSIEIKYKTAPNQRLSMFIILPNQIGGLAKLEKNLEEVTVNKILASFADAVKVDLYLPKFKIESLIDLQEPLEKLNLTDMFNDASNFAGIADSPQLKVAKLIQKAFIEVNEEGSPQVTRPTSVNTLKKREIVIEQRKKRSEEPKAEVSDERQVESVIEFDVNRAAHIVVIAGKTKLFSARLASP